MAAYTLTQLKALVEPVARRHGAQKVSVFGSYARGQATEKSDVDLHIEKGQMKTLLHIIAGVDVPTGGKVYLEGQDVYAQNREKLAIFRRRQVGLIYQFHNLIAIGRALMNAPAVVLADEPTGSLDSRNSHEIIRLLRESHEKYRQTLIIVTHDENIALQADRIITIADGKAVRDERQVAQR